MPRPTTHRPDLHPGDLRLLHDLAVVEAMMDEPLEPAQDYIERVLGADFARALHASLVGTAAKAA